jgi:hypothetical protein
MKHFALESKRNLMPIETIKVCAVFVICECLRLNFPRRFHIIRENRKIQHSSRSQPLMQKRDESRKGTTWRIHYALDKAPKTAAVIASSECWETIQSTQSTKINSSVFEYLRCLPNFPHRELPILMQFRLATHRFTLFPSSESNLKLLPTLAVLKN